MIRAGVLASLLACGSKAREPVTHQVEIRAMTFVPAELTVGVGDTVVWVNRDVVPHTVTSKTFDSQSLATQQVWSLSVSAAGEIPYVCTFHPTMTGKLTVR